MQNIGGSSEQKLAAMAYFRRDDDSKHAQAIRDAAAQLLTDGDTAVALTAFSVIQEREPTNLDVFRQRLTAAPNPVKQKILTLLAGQDAASSAEIFVRYLYHEDEAIRATAAKAIEKVGAAAEPALIQAVADQQTDPVRHRALLVLLAPHATNASLPLMRDASNDKDPQVRRLAREAWQRLEPASFNPVNCAVMDLDTDPFASVAVLAGAEPDDRRSTVVPKLYALLDRDMPSVEEAANLGKALGRWADDATIAQLTERLDHNRSEPRRAVIAAAVAMRHPANAARPMLELIVNEWPAVREPLVSMGQVIEADTVTLVANADPQIRIKACDLLGCVGATPAARGVLLNASRSDKVPQVREAAKWAYTFVAKRAKGEQLEAANRPADTLLAKFNEPPRP